MTSPTSSHQASASHLSVAIDHAKHGRRVALCCPPGPNSGCICGGKWDDRAKQLVPHAPKEVGKAPIGRFFPRGINDATTNTATLDKYLRALPEANISIDLQSAGWLVADTDSPEADAAEQAHGLDGAVVRESRNRAYVFRRPADCPIINLIKADGDPLDILTFGNFLVHGTHRSGAPIRLDPHARPGPAPARYVEMLKRKAAENAVAAEATAARRAERAALYGGGPEPPVRLHQRGQRRWTGELVEPDRSDSLFYLGLDLAECGASESAITAALEERDASLGWNKYTGRKDNREYVRIAEKAVARAVEQERAPRIQFSPKATDGDTAAQLEAAEAEMARLRRALLDRDDRLEVLEDYVHTIDDVLANPGMSATDKVVVLATTREVHTRLSKGKEHIALGRLADLTGMHKNTVSKAIDRVSSTNPDARAPFRKVQTRTRNDDPEGPPFITTIAVTPWAERPRETLAVAAAYAPLRPDGKRGQSPKAAAMRWKRCGVHEDAEALVRGVCTVCGDVLGEQRVRPDQLESLNHTLGDSAKARAHTVSNVRMGHTLGDSDPPSAARAAAMVNTQLSRDAADRWKRLDPAPQEPVNLGRIRMTRDQEPPADQPPTDQCVYGDGPLAPGHRALCAYHRDLLAAQPLAVAGGEE